MYPNIYLFWWSAIDNNTFLCCNFLLISVSLYHFLFVFALCISLLSVFDSNSSWVYLNDTSNLSCSALTMNFHWILFICLNFVFHFSLSRRTASLSNELLNNCLWQCILLLNSMESFFLFFWFIFLNSNANCTF